ncbi:hypothetical protein PG984_014596 [Apiospora sp. TS-2023a]
MVSSPDDEEAASSSSSLHVLLVSHLPLSSIQTSSSVKSTDRLGPNMVLFRLAPGTATLFAADSAHSDVAFQVGQDNGNNNNILQLPEFLIWCPLPGIGGGAPQLLNKNPSGRGLLVYSRKRNEEGEAGRGRRDSDGDDEHNSNSKSKLAAGESIAIETTATTAAEIVVPIHSAEKRRWRMGYYVVAPRYPRETIAKLLGGGGQRQMSPLWFSSDPSSGEPEETGGESDGEDVEMEEAAADEDEDEDERGSSGSSSTAPSPPPAAKKSAREARARRRRRRRRKRQLAAEDDDANASSKRRGAGKRAATAKGTKASKNRVAADETEDEEESEPEPADTDDDDDKGRERSGLDHTPGLAQTPG